MEAIGGAALAVEHIGSTAVPGLAAKPIVDIVLAVTDIGDEARFVPQLEGAGYVLRVREPDHFNRNSLTSPGARSRVGDRSMR